MKTALITGITGQDGSYLAEFLLAKGYQVHGMIRRHSTPSTGRIDHIFGDLQLHYGDVTDINSCIQIVRDVKPDEVYNLAAQSHVRTSFDIPIYTANATGVGALYMLEASRGYGLKFYQASSSELFGGIQTGAQSERTPFYPRSPYGVAKQFAYSSAVNYREAHDMFACNGILFNHESPRRGETFVTRKITKAVARIANGDATPLHLGNLDARRDWGYAKEYVESMWMMLQHDVADDYVIATGETHTVREFLEEAFSLIGKNWQDYVQIDPKYFRPTEVDMLLGDPTKAEAVLGWKPKTTFKQLVQIMVEADLKAGS